MNFTIDLIGSQFMDWESFDCGSPRLTRKLAREAALADRGFQKLYGAFPNASETELAGVMTLRAGQVKAPPEDLAQLAGQTGVTIPTLHIEVLAVQSRYQGRGAGMTLLDNALDLAASVRRSVGLYTLSLEATPESVAFYERYGFLSSDTIYPDGSRAM